MKEVSHPAPSTSPKRTNNDTEALTCLDPCNIPNSGEADMALSSCSEKEPEVQRSTITCPNEPTF